MTSVQTNLHRVLWCSLPALMLSASCLGPYLQKAFTIDDPTYLLQAQHIRKAPLRPTEVEICWTDDNFCGPMGKNAANNLLMSYMLAPLLAIGGEERLVHLTQIVIVWFGIVATVSLAFRFGLNAFAATSAGLILAASPPVLAMASTAFPDVLAMALGVIGIERLVAWKQERRWIDGVLSMVALGLAPFTRLHLALLWPVAALLLLDDLRVRVISWDTLRRLWWPVAGAIVVWAAANALTGARGSTGVGYLWTNPVNVHRNLRSYLLEWIVAMPLGLAWIVLRNRRIKPWLVAALAAFAVWRIWRVPSITSWRTLCAGVGLVVIIDLFLLVFKSRDVRRIACALWLLIPLAALEYMHRPVKYLVPCAPAAALLIADLLESFKWRVAALCVITAVGATFGSMVLYADNRFAEMGRAAASRLIAPHVAAGQRVWFASQWGFYWYALKDGGKVLWTNDVPAPGDFLARGEMEGWPGTLKRLPPAVLVESYTVGGPGGRTMSLKDGAGLYANYFGDVIWAWGSGEWNRYELWRFQ